MATKLVISTNVLIGHALWEDSAANQAVDKAFENGKVCRSDISLYILRKVLMDKRFDKYLSVPDRERFLKLFEEITEPSDIKKKIKLCPNLHDNAILELAFNCMAPFVIAGEPALLQHDRFVDPIHVLTPFAFMQECPNSAGDNPPANQA